MTSVTNTPHVNLEPAKGRGCRQCLIGTILPLTPADNREAYLPGLSLWGEGPWGLPYTCGPQTLSLFTV